VPSNNDAKITPKEIRDARAVIQSQGLTAYDVPPRSLVVTAKKTGKRFIEILREIARLKMGGQGQGQSEQTVVAIKETKENK